MRFVDRLLLLLLILAFGLLAVTSSSAQVKKVSASRSRTITINTEPLATVWLDDVRYGTTDEAGSLDLKAVPAGKHSLRVRAAGFKEISLPLTAVQQGIVKVTLVKTTDEAELAYQDGERLAAVDRERSAEAYRKAAQLRPAYPQAYLALARVLMEAGNLDEAKKAIAAARRLRPGYAEASAVEGRINKENGDEEKAVASFRRAITEGKGFQPEAYTGLGLLFKEKAQAAAGSGDFAAESELYTEASKYLRTAIKQLGGAPDASVIYQLLGLVYENQKRYNEAIALYEEFLSVFPDSPDATAVRSFIVQLKKSRDGQ
jgi:tetratricopeptide (TPR) repeat protein